MKDTREKEGFLVALSGWGLSKIQAIKYKPQSGNTKESYKGEAQGNGRIGDWKDRLES